LQKTKDNSIFQLFPYVHADHDSEEVINEIKESINNLKTRLSNLKKINKSLNDIDNNSSTRVVNVDRDQFGDRFFSGFEGSSHSYFADEVLSKQLIEKEILY